MTIGPNIIGLCGPKHGGKDTAAKFIMEMDVAFRRVAFADVMKQMALAIDPLVDTDVTSYEKETIIRLSVAVERAGWEEAKKLPDVRRFLQRLGTEGGRECLYQNVWVDNTWSKDVVPLRGRGFKVVITDVRFANEIKQLRAKGGDLWRIDRPEVEDGDNHPSEREWRQAAPDLVIKNDSTLAHLKWSVAMALGTRVPL